MEQTSLDNIYKISHEVVAREIDGKIIIVPIVGGIGSMDDDLYTLNSTGQEVWKLINGKNSIDDMANILEKKYHAPVKEITNDIIGLINDLKTRGIIIAA